MLNKVLILRKDSGILLLDETIKDLNYDSKLFSGLLTAVKNLCLEINIGECSIFSSDKYKVVTTSGEQITVTFIIDKADPHIESYWSKLGKNIAETFEEKYDLTKFHGNINIFKDFHPIMHKILERYDIFI